MWNTLRTQKSFSKLFYASLISAIGSHINRIALMLLVYSLTEEALWVSLTLGVQLVTSIVVGPLISAWADTRERRTLLVASDLVRIPLVILIPVAGVKHLGILLVIVFAMEAVRNLRFPVANAVIPDLVPEDQVDTANSLMQFSTRFAEVVFVGLAGLLVAAVGPAPAFWIDAGTFLISGLVVMGLPRIEPGEKDEDRYWSRVRAGIDHLVQTPVIRRTVGTLFCAAMFGSVEAVLGVVLAVSVFQVGSSGFGIMEAGMALGSILGTFLVIQLVSRVGREKIFLMGLIGFGLFEASIGVNPTFAWAILAYFASGVLNMVFIVPAQSILQLNTPPELRTRTFAAFGAVMNTAVIAGTMMGGALEKPLGVPMLFLLAGLGVFGIALTVLVRAQIVSRRLVPTPQAHAELGAD